jgi:hypothetical protein
MRRLLKVLSVAATAVLLSVLTAYAGEEGSAEETHAFVVRAPAGSAVSWYEITVLAGVPQEIAAFDVAGDELVHQINPAVSGRAENWCPLLQQAIQQCESCAEVVANSGC